MARSMPRNPLYMIIALLVAVVIIYLLYSLIFGGSPATPVVP